MAPSPERIARWREQLLKQPDAAEVINELWWQEVAARIAEIPNDDERNQAEHHLEMLLTFLGGADDCEAS